MCLTRLESRRATLLELASAYSTFPNHGIRMEPFYANAITDREGTGEPAGTGSPNTLEEAFISGTQPSRQ